MIGEQTLARYIELKEMIRENAKEMKPLKDELKEIEEMLINSGQEKFTYYGKEIIIAEKETEKMMKEEVEALIGKEIRNSNGDGLTYNDFYEKTTKKSVRLKSQKKGKRDDE